jgi:hypothetical protein
MWLFKPNMRLSYRASKHYLLPEHGTIQAAKVLFKVLGPSMSSMDLGSLLDRYPGFPQAEQLMYPKNTCTQIALLLRESNACYPEGMRSMTRLDVGWLLRAWTFFLVSNPYLVSSGHRFCSQMHIHNVFIVIPTLIAEVFYHTRAFSHNYTSDVPITTQQVTDHRMGRMNSYSHPNDQR